MTRKAVVDALRPRCSEKKNAIVFHRAPLPHESGAMAASPGGDILAQLACLLGKEDVRIRKTEEERPRISVYDVATLVTGKAARKAAQDVGFVKHHYTEVAQNREDQAGRSPHPPATVQDRPSVIALLQRASGVA